MNTIAQHLNVFFYFYFFRVRNEGEENDGNIQNTDPLTSTLFVKVVYFKFEKNKNNIRVEFVLGLILN